MRTRRGCAARPDAIPRAGARAACSRRRAGRRAATVQPWRVIAVRDRALVSSSRAYAGALHVYSKQHMAQTGRARGAARAPARMLAAGDYLATFARTPVVLVLLQPEADGNHGHQAERVSWWAVVDLPRGRERDLACRAEGLGGVPTLCARGDQGRAMLAIPSRGDRGRGAARLPVAPAKTITRSPCELAFSDAWDTTWGGA